MNAFASIVAYKDKFWKSDVVVYYFILD